MRTIKVVVDFDVYKAGDHIEVEDQVALDACVQGYAVGSVDALEGKAIESAPENKAIESAPENK